jgi:hypothetical protein
VTTTLDAIEGGLRPLRVGARALRFHGAPLRRRRPQRRIQGIVRPTRARKAAGESALGATLSAKNLALARLGPYVGAKQEADPGVLSLDATANGAFLGALKLAGNLTLVPREGGGPLPALDGQLTAILDWPHGALTSSRRRSRSRRFPSCCRDIDGLRTTPRVDLRFTTPGEVAIDGVSGLPDAAGTLPADLKISGRVRLTAEVAGSAADRTRHASLAAVPLEVSQGGQPVLSAPSATATLESRGGEPPAGRLAIPSGKLKGLSFQNVLADWTVDKGVLTLSRADAADAADARLRGSLEARGRGARRRADEAARTARRSGAAGGGRILSGAIAAVADTGAALNCLSSQERHESSRGLPFKPNREGSLAPRMTGSTISACP